MGRYTGIRYCVHDQRRDVGDVARPAIQVVSVAIRILFRSDFPNTCPRYGSGITRIFESGIIHVGCGSIIPETATKGQKYAGTAAAGYKEVRQLA
jgi:hypothetical protein